jgi:nitroreductase
MMDEKKTVSILLSRRSIRRYLKQSVSANYIEQILQAGMCAPSSLNRQPWHFIIIDDERILRKIPEFHEYAKMLKEAPVAIVVCGDTKCLSHKEEWIMDCSAAAENMLLAAHELGLGSVWVGIFPYENRIAGMRQLVDIPSEFIPLCVLPIGYPAEEKKPVKRFDASRIHINCW